MLFFRPAVHMRALSMVSHSLLASFILHKETNIPVEIFVVCLASLGSLHWIPIEWCLGEPVGTLDLGKLGHLLPSTV